MTLFVIPMMFLQCMQWQPLSEPYDAGELRGFKFEQAVTVHATKFQALDVIDSTFDLSYGCPALYATDGSQINFSGMVAVK